LHSHSTYIKENRVHPLKTCGIIVLLYCAASCHAQMGFTVTPSEYQVKAKFLVNFARFVQWPNESFTDEQAPIIIGIYGNDPFGIDIDKTVEGKHIEGRELVIRRIQDIRALECCHILFVGSCEKRRTAHILNMLNEKRILTVGETDGFIQAGGIINFIIQTNKVRFEINPAAADRSGLWISSQLLKLALPSVSRPAGSV
jgi:hypothetical protein